MYRLMVVTDSDSTKEFLENYTEWLRNGFKRPHYRKDKETLIEGLSKHHIDAIAIDLSNGDTYKSVIAFLKSDYPMLPIFHIKRSYEEQDLAFATLMNCLEKINADISDDELSYEQRFEAVRNRWLSKYMRGKLTSYDEFLDKYEIYRTGFSIDNPCILVKLNLDGDDYFQNKWKYGADRLEVALRNFLRPEINDLNITIAVEENEICKILFSNLDIEEDKNNYMKHIKGYLEASSSEIQQFLGISIEIKDLIYFKNHKQLFDTIMIK